MPIRLKTLGCPIEAVESAVVGANPDCSRSIFPNRADIVVAQAIRVGRIVFVYHHRIAIVAVEAVVGTEPHIAAAILQHTRNRGLRQALLQ